MASQEFPISGFAETPFARVREAFAANFAEGHELGARFSVFVEGRCVVDLVGGYANRERQRLWAEDTLTGVYSSGKLIVALLVARAVSEGKLDYDAPVARWWPEFAANGKADVTLAEALSHQAGLVGFADETPADIWLDFERTATRFAAMAPLFPPRSASGYGPQSFGFVAGAILRRATGRGVAQILREDFGDIDVRCALRPEEIARAAYMQKPQRAPDLGPLTELKRIAFLKPWSAPGNVSREAWMAAEIPSANIHASARGLAELAHPLANGGIHRGTRIISVEALDAAFAERIVGDDLVLPFRLSWAAGMMRNINGHFGPSATALGHAGFGGSSVTVDPAHRLSAAYAMNKMSPHLVGDPRGVRLMNAVYEAL